MIRGYHGIKTNAFYFVNTLLEHTYPNGTWIKKEDKQWIDGKFKIVEKYISWKKSLVYWIINKIIHYIVVKLDDH